MNNRLKKLRKELELTQKQFAEALHIKQNTVATYEMGRIIPSDSVIAGICREFNVNEEWLRNGTGSMFIEIDKENQLMQWAANVLKDESDSFKRRFVNMLMSLSEDEWELIERKAKELVKENKES